jgi:hypothetical protein
MFLKTDIVSCQQIDNFGNIIKYTRTYTYINGYMGLVCNSVVEWLPSMSETLGFLSLHHKEKMKHKWIMKYLLL